MPVVAIACSTRRLIVEQQLQLDPQDAMLAIVDSAFRAEGYARQVEVVIA